VTRFAVVVALLGACAPPVGADGRSAPLAVTVEDAPADPPPPAPAPQTEQAMTPREVDDLLRVCRQRCDTIPDTYHCLTGVVDAPETRRADVLDAIASCASSAPRARATLFGFALDRNAALRKLVSPLLGRIGALSPQSAALLPASPEDAWSRALPMLGPAWRASPPGAACAPTGEDASGVLRLECSRTVCEGLDQRRRHRALFAVTASGWALRATSSALEPAHGACGDVN
jgi:hypothetical protein